MLVSTKKERARYTDLKPDEITDLWLTVQRVQKAVESEYNAKSSTLTIQDGKDAGQTVPHVHVHIIPRTPGDFDRNDEVYDKVYKLLKYCILDFNLLCIIFQLKNHDKSENRQKRSLEEMREEALKLRKHFYNM